MSIEAMAVVLHHSRAKGTAKLVLLGIANHQGDGGAWPSVATLARYANVTERNVQKAIDQLEAKGELRRQVQHGGTHELPDHRRPNRYDVLVSCPSWCDRSANHRDTRGPAAGFALGPLSTRVSDATPHRRGRGVASDTRTPVASDTQTVPRTPTQQVVSQPQDARARTNTAPCQDCGADEWTCQRRQARLAQDDRHPYRGPRP